MHHTKAVLEARSWACSSDQFRYPPPPTVWSASSLIFFPHPIQPLVNVRHFSSSAHLTLPSPVPLVASPETYSPPTVISASPSDEMVFAFFPSKQLDSICCLWKRGLQVDNWEIKEYWSVPQNAGIVAASWVGSNRQLDIDASGEISRLPFKGPELPLVAGPTLLLITQSHQLHVCFFKNYTYAFEIMACSLTEAGHVAEPAPPPRPENNDSLPTRSCIKAAIGLGYSENTFLIATRSQLYPCRPPTEQFDSINLPLDINEEQTKDDADNPVKWDSWGEEDSIHIARVLVQFDGSQMGLSVDPLTPIYHPYPHLASMAFVSKPPSTENQVYLAANFRDFGDFISCPKTELVLYSTSRAEGENKRWGPHLDCTRTYTSEVVDFLAEAHSGSGLFIGIMDVSGMIPRSHPSKSRVKIGKIAVLRIPDLSDNVELESSPIVVPDDIAGYHLPLSIAISPNATLACTIFPTFGKPQLCVQAVPQRKPFNLPRFGPVLIPPLSISLALALIARQATDDITFSLTSHSASMEEISDTLYCALLLSETKQNGHPSLRTYEALGIIIESYRTRARYSQDSDERLSFGLRWATAHDICSLSACKRAFEECKEKDDEYDTDAVWQLVGLSSWVVEFVEKLLGECVKSCSLSEAITSDDSVASEAASFDAVFDRLNAPILLHLAQPFALFHLQTLLEHVKKFRCFLNAAQSSRDENVEIARSTLTDLVDCSGVDLNLLGSILQDSKKDLTNIGVDEGRRCLASCQPTAAMKPIIYKTIKAILEKDVVDKARLFIKPTDLIEGISTLTLPVIFGRPKKGAPKDIITKIVWSYQSPVFRCLRCDGHSQVGINSAKLKSLRWRAWEKAWSRKCICGGAWANYSSGQ